MNNDIHRETKLRLAQTVGAVMEERGYVAPVELVPAGRPSAPADPCKAGNPSVVGPAVPESSVGVASALSSVPEKSAGEASTTASSSVTVVPASVLFADALKDLPKNSFR